LRAPTVMPNCTFDQLVYFFYVQVLFLIPGKRNVQTFQTKQTRHFDNAF